MLFANCSNEEPSSSTPSTEDINDLTYGYNSIIIDIENITSIPINSDSDITLICENPNVDFIIEKLNGKQVLTPILKHSTDKYLNPFSVKVRLNVGDNNSATSDKDIYVSFRHKSKDVDVSYANAIGKGTKPWGDIGNVTYPILSFNTIHPNLAINENITLNSIFFEVAGNRYTESLENIASNVGLSGTILTKGVLLTMGGSYGYNSNKMTSNAFEYYIGYYGKCMAEVKLNTDWLVSKSNTYNQIALLDETVNDVLNNPSSKAYQQYANDKEGIFKLLDKYGTHIITKAVFGGNYCTLYAREENAYETSIGHDAAASISGTTSISGKTWSEIYVNKTNSPAISINASGSNYSKDYDEASKSFYTVIAKGGNASQDMTHWDESITLDSKNTWVPISYLTTDATDKNDNGLIPLSKFVVDDNRKAAIEKYINDYYNNLAINLEEQPIVIADFMMVLGEDDHQKDEPKSFVSVDPFGNKRIYFPMMANEKAPVGQGYAIETSSSDYISASDNKDHYWYYALGHLDKNQNFYGYTDIKFDNEHCNGYISRGNHANEGITGELRNNYVWLKPATINSSSSEIITGIALKSEHGDIIASTGGTEMKYPWGVDGYANFTNYWSENKYKEPSISEEWYKGLLTSCNFKPVFTTLALDSCLSFGNGRTTGKISHPQKWD